MKCSECLKQGLTSHIYLESTSRTSAWNPPFFDKDGAFHSHDTNQVTRVFSCSQGHKWETKNLIPCPNPSCAYGQEPAPSQNVEDVISQFLFTEMDIKAVNEMGKKLKEIDFFNKTVIFRDEPKVELYKCPVCKEDMEFRHKCQLSEDLGKALNSFKYSCPSGHTIFIEDWGIEEKEPQETYLNIINNSIRGEVVQDEGDLIYYYSIDTLGDNEESHDYLWSVFCEDINIIRNLYPTVQYKESWADNDSTGCIIECESLTQKKGEL